MQKKYLASMILLLSVVFLGFGCAKKDINQSKENGANNGNQVQNQGGDQSDEVSNLSGSYSINELFNMKRPMKCSWKESATGDSDVTNIMYIEGKKFYQDVTMGDIGHAFTIFDGEYLYIWNDFTNVASKMKNTEATTQQTNQETQGSAGMDQKKDFVCDKWSSDDSFFEPPKDRTFKDVTDEMNQAFEGLNEGGLDDAKQQICDMCNNAPTQELKDQCLENSECDE